MSETGEGLGSPEHQPPREIEFNQSFLEVAAAAASHEARATMLLKMKPDTLYTGADLEYLVLGPESPDQPIVVTRGVVSSYCETTLMPVGLVDKVEHPPESGEEYYRLSKVGAELGGPLGAWAYAFAEKTEGALTSTFGSLQSREGKRTGGPIRRLTILAALASSEEPVSVYELGEKSGVNQEVDVHLRVLQAARLIEVDEYPERNQIAYTFEEENSGKIANIGSKTDPPSIAHLARQALLELGSGATLDQIHKAVVTQLDPSMSIEPGEMLRTRINQQMLRLKDKGLVTYTRRSKSEASMVKLQENVADFIRQAMADLEQTQNGDDPTIARYQQIAKTYKDNDSLREALLRRGYEQSAHTDAPSIAEHKARILGIIRHSDQPRVSAQDIQAAFPELPGQPITIHRINVILARLEEDNLIKFFGTGDEGQHMFRVVADSNDAGVQPTRKINRSPSNKASLEEWLSRQWQDLQNAGSDDSPNDDPFGVDDAYNEMVNSFGYLWMEPDDDRRVLSPEQQLERNEAIEEARQILTLKRPDGSPVFTADERNVLREVYGFPGAADAMGTEQISRVAKTLGIPKSVVRECWGSAMSRFKRIYRYRQREQDRIDKTEVEA